MINNGYDPLLILGKGGLGYHYDIPMFGYGFPRPDGLTRSDIKFLQGLPLDQGKEYAESMGIEYDIYVALTPSERKYLRSLPPQEAIDIVNSFGISYDPYTDKKRKKKVKEIKVQKEEEEEEAEAEAEAEAEEEQEVKEEVKKDEMEEALDIMEEIKRNKTSRRSIVDEVQKIMGKKFKIWDFEDGYYNVEKQININKNLIRKDNELSAKEKEDKLIEEDKKLKTIDILRKTYLQYEDQNKALKNELVKNPKVSIQNVDYFRNKIEDADDIVNDVVKLRYPETIDGRIETKIQEALAPGSEVMKEYDKKLEEYKKKPYLRKPTEPGLGIGFEYALTNNPKLMEELTEEKHTNIQNTKDAYKQLGDEADFFVADAIDDNSMWEFKYYAKGGLEYNALNIEKDGYAPLTYTKFTGTGFFDPYFIEDKGKYKLYNVWDTKKGAWVDTNPKLREYKALWAAKDGYWSYDIANDPSMKYDTSWFKLQNKHKPIKTIPDIGMVGNKPLLKMLPPTYNSIEVQKKKSYLIPKDKLKFLKPKMPF